jgi:hypothetical protein
VRAWRLPSPRAFYETFAELNYNSGGVNLNGLLNYDKKFKQGAGVQMSLIDKPNKLTPSLGLNGLLEYHLLPPDQR